MERRSFIGSVMAFCLAPLGAREACCDQPLKYTATISGVGEPFDPRKIYGTVFWIDPERGTVLDSSGKVALIIDQSTCGNHIVTVTPLDSPSSTRT